MSYKELSYKSKVRLAASDIFREQRLEFKSYHFEGDLVIMSQSNGKSFSFRVTESRIFGSDLNIIKLLERRVTELERECVQSIDICPIAPKISSLMKTIMFNEQRRD